MSLRINQNTAAINAHRNLAATDNMLSKSIERLSSGFRVNSAADDPAGLVISEKLRAQIGGLGQAISNSQDAVNVVKTAEASLTEVHSILRSMRDLAVHASNTGTNDSASVAADQAQITSAIATLNRISSNTQFGTRSLLDGTSGLNAVIGNSGIKSVVVNQSSTLGFATLDITQLGAKASYNTSVTSYGAVTDAVANAGTIIVNGVSINIGASDTVQTLMGKINDSNSGVTATWNTTQVVLTQKEAGSFRGISYSESASILNGATSATSAGVDAIATITYADGTVEALQGAGDQLRGASGTIVTLDPANAAVGTYTNAVLIKDDSLQFQVGAFAGQHEKVSIQSTAANNLGINAIGLVNKNWTVADMDVTTITGAQDSLKILDAAISEVSTRRADLGAFQKNVLESNISSLSVAKENISASESSIRDTDMASEMVAFTRNQILMQAGTSMLTQANQLPQNLLSLIKG